MNLNANELSNTLLLILQEKYSLGNKKDVCEYIGISQASLSMMLKRDSFGALLVSVFEKVSLGEFAEIVYELTKKINPNICKINHTKEDIFTALHNGAELQKIEKLALACDGQDVIEKGLLAIKSQLLKKVNDEAFWQNNSHSIQENTVSEKIKKIRKSLNYDQQELADILNISRPTYSRIESNKNDIGAVNLSYLFSKLQVSPLWFFSDIGPMFLNERKDIQGSLK